MEDSRFSLHFTHARVSRRAYRLEPAPQPLLDHCDLVSADYTDDGHMAGTISGKAGGEREQKLQHNVRGSSCDRRAGTSVRRSFLSPT